METSIFMAKAIGIVLTIASVSIILNKKRMLAMVNDLFKNNGLIYIAGMMSFILGTIMVLSHNVWEGTWQIIVSIVSWLVLMKGGLYLLIPETMTHMAKKVSKSEAYYNIALSINLLLGLYLLSVGLGWIS